VRTILAAAAAAAVLLAGCGGGGSALKPLPAPDTTRLSGAQTATMTVIVGGRSGAVTSSVKRPRFISPSTNGIDITVHAHGGVAVIGNSKTDISSGSAACGGQTGLPRTCTISVPAPAGNDDFVGTTYDTAPSGNSFGSGHVLGIGTLTASIVSGASNNFTLYISGVINALGFLAPNASLPADGATHTFGFILNPSDFDNNAITAGANDPYQNPIGIQLTESGASGHTILIKNGAPSGTSATLTRSSDTISVQYDGGGFPGYSIAVAVSAGNVTPETLTVSPLYVTSTSSRAGNKSLTYTAAGQTAQVNFFESGAPAATQYTATSSTCGGIASTSPIAQGSNSSTTVTAVGNGNCSITFSDGTSSITWTVTITTTGGTININSHTVGPIVFDNYNDGALGGQHGWATNACGNSDYDAAVVPTSSFSSAHWTGFSTPVKAMRFSNAVTQGCFSGLGSPVTPSSAGYPNALADTSGATPTQCGPTCESFWTEEFVVTSSTGGFQPQLEMSISPVWSNQGARMSYVGLWHTVDSSNNPKLLVFGYDVEGLDPGNPPGTTAPCLQCVNFTGYELAYVDATLPHKIGMTMQFVQPNQDVVKYYVDGVQVGQTSGYRSWEDYYLMDTESDPGYQYPYSRAVNDLLFRAGNVDGCVNFADNTCNAGPSGHTATAGNGFLFTNVTTCAGAPSVCSAAIQTSSVRRSPASVRRTISSMAGRELSRKLLR
jgi:hypothetical protein